MPKAKSKKKTKAKATSSIAQEQEQVKTPSSPRRRKHLQPIAAIPILFTLGNLIAGFAAIHYASKPIDFSGPWGWSSLTMAGALVFLGMIFDAVDGSIARLTKTESELGAQLDSLADMVTFGIVPAFMMLRLASHYVGGEGTLAILDPAKGDAFTKVLWGVSAAYVACTALRLARFNVETPSGHVDHHMIFRGLPSPGAAGAVASLIVLHQHYLAVRGVDLDHVTLAFARWTAFGMPIITLLCAIAMVSSIPYIHFINRYARGQHSFGYVSGLVICLLLLFLWFQEVTAVVFTIFALSGPFRLMALWMKRRRSSPS
ncbi:MAG: CDP-alcohol phosphatidyltransferase family protein [Planctomycetota bacterium]|nr:CDP-alcohol phosphatidyltransferase family protein [Planctomycetota bacterium]